MNHGLFPVMRTLTAGTDSRSASLTTGRLGELRGMRHMLVGRSSEIQQITVLIEQTPLAPGQLLFVQLDGEIGAGKSALLSAVLCVLHETAQAEDPQVEDAQAEGNAPQVEDAQAEGNAPQGSTAQPEVASARQPQRRIFLAQGDLPRAEAPLTAFRLLLEELLGASLERLLDSATPSVLALRCLEELGTRPVLIAVDDAHWLDPASAVFLEALVLAPGRGPMTVVAVHRTGQAPAGLVAAARRRGALHGHHTVQPLSDMTVGAIAAELPDHQAAEVVAAARGNPLLAHTAVAGFRQHPQATRVDEVIQLAGERGPAGLASAIGTELDTLTKAARRTLETLAVVGEAPVETLAQISELEHGDVRAGARELSERGLLTDSAHEVLHPVVRFSVYQRTDTDRRQETHRRAAHLPGLELFDRADHLAGVLAAARTRGNTGALGDTGALGGPSALSDTGMRHDGAACAPTEHAPLAPAEVAVLTDAAAVAIGTDPRAVVRWLADIPPPLRTHTSEALLARALVLTGETQDAVERLRALAQETGSAEAHVRLANALRITGSTGEARALLARAHQWAGDTDSRLLREYIDVVGLIDGSVPEELVSRLEALSREAPLGSQEAASDAQGSASVACTANAGEGELNRTVAAIYRTMTLLAEGRVAQARTTFSRVAVWAEQVPGEELAEVLHAAACAVWDAYMLDEYERGAALASRALQLARRHGRRMCSPTWAQG